MNFVSCNKGCHAVAGQCIKLVLVTSILIFNFSLNLSPGTPRFGAQPA